MKKNIIFFSLLSIILSLSVLVMSCKSDKEEKKETTTPESELEVAAQDGFSYTHVFPNNTFKPSKVFLPNDDIALRPEVILKGQIPDAEATYDITLVTDYYDDVDVSDCKYVVTAISPDSASRRTQTYKIIFNDSQEDKVLSSEGGRTLKRQSKRVFQGMKFSTVGEAKFKVELAPGHGRFMFTGIKSLSVKVEKVKK